MKALAEMSAAEASGFRYMLMDIDDTLTTAGKLPAVAYAALWRLAGAGLKVIPVTGRPAGWCDLIAREWPVDGVVGENGALVFWEEDDGSAAEVGAHNTAQNAAPSMGGRRVLKQEFHPQAVRNDHPVLEKIKKRALEEITGLRMAKDQFARLFDIALDFAEEDPVLPLETAERVRAIAEEEGARAKISSIHVNVWMGEYDKLSMAEHFLQSRFGWRGGTEAAYREVLFAGDSPNDEPMFARFPLACGVANVERYRNYMKHLPGFIASREGGEGFAEIAETVLAKRAGGYG
ncbi:MAG: HAD-IIB family hydrolase [Treponema sp.]|jgi:HAD superfamily hydrolase (TIGR01484 family)|nr:HAD-IIB family hydrolase [Treponema sp.]